MSQPDKLFYLYKISNTKNTHIYIGQTDNPAKRWKQHKQSSKKPKVPVQFALHKYKIENFIFEELACALTRDDANFLEQLLIAQYNSQVPNGYNIDIGGGASPRNDLTIKKISKSMKGKSHPNSRKQNILNERFGSLEVIEELSSKPGKPKRPRWKCKCDCGNIIIVNRGCDLKSGNTNSCGCVRSEKASKRASKRNFDNRKHDPRIATALRVYKEYCNSELTFEEFLEKSQKNCYYCNAPPANSRTSNVKKSSNFYIENSLFVYSGLHRINSKLPHSKENSVSCCKECRYI